MKGGNRTVWVVVIILVLLILLCCCAVVASGALLGGLYALPISRETGFARVEESSQQTFTVGTAPALEVENFAGTIAIRGSQSGQISVIVSKRAMNTRRLNDIDVAITERDDGLRIETSHSRPGVGNLAVDLEITLPSDASVTVDTGAGRVRVAGVTGRVTAHSGAGNVVVEGGTGPVALDTGAGEIEYGGEPAGECSFRNGAGNITLRLPSDLDAALKLGVGIGRIDLGGFDVDGEIGSTEVDGLIGTGDDATIVAHTGAGSIRLDQR